MAGRGPSPKDPEKRARRNADPIPPTTIPFIPGEQPSLPQMTKDDPDLGSVVVPWHPQTIAWWEMWGRAAQSDTFTESDWSYMLETAFLHHLFWNGDTKQAPELRQRQAKFGATPEDRARLRMFFADATGKEAKVGHADSSSGPKPASPYGGLRAVPQP